MASFEGELGLASPPQDITFCFLKSCFYAEALYKYVDNHACFITIAYMEPWSPAMMPEPDNV
jgi:hypothetical protein